MLCGLDASVRNAVSLLPRIDYRFLPVINIFFSASKGIAGEMLRNRMREMLHPWVGIGTKFVPKVRIHWFFANFLKKRGVLYYSFVNLTTTVLINLMTPTFFNLL